MPLNYEQLQFVDVAINVVFLTSLVEINVKLEMILEHPSYQLMVTHLIIHLIKTVTATF